MQIVDLVEQLVLRLLHLHQLRTVLSLDENAGSGKDVRTPLPLAIHDILTRGEHPDPPQSR